MQEVDLMKLVIQKPNDPNPGQNMITLQVIGDAELWQSPNKVTLAPLAYAPADIPASGLTVWVEATDTSGELRDITIRMNHRGAKFTVVATGIWAEKTAFWNNGDSAPADADDLWFRFNFDSQLPAQNEISDGKPRLGAVRISPRTNNGMIIQFTVYPSRIGLEPGIAFDVSRNMELMVWRWNPVQVPDPPIVFPSFLDQPNDDGSMKDEDNDPRAYLGPLPVPPNTVPAIVNTDHIYALDFVGFVNDLATHDRVARRHNFNEFVRATVNGEGFTLAQTVQGSRASNLIPWRSRLDVLKDLTNLNPANKPRWKRTPDEVNEIAEGHAPLTPF